MNLQESFHRDLYEPLRVLGGPKNLQECQRISRSFKLFLGVHKSPYGSPGLFKMPKLSQGVSRSFREPQRMLLYMIFMSVKDSPGVHKSSVESLGGLQALQGSFRANRNLSTKA